MRAMQFTEYGGPDRLQESEIAPPAIGSDGVLISVLASSINPIDWKLASGKLRMVMPVSRPATPGFDVVGTVVELGSAVTGFAVGQRVVARIAESPGGACAELCVATLDQVTALPEGVDPESAAALPLAGMTALQALRDNCGLKLSGETRRVLIVGASGGVGHYAVQIAAASGAHVTGVCSTPNVELVRDLGADVVIDYRKQSGFETDGLYDIILDCADSHGWDAFVSVMAPRSVLALSTPGPAWLPRVALQSLSSKRVKMVMLKPNAKDLALLLGRMANGELRSVVGARYPMEQLSSAWTLAQKGGFQGKIVMLPFGAQPESSLP